MVLERSCTILLLEMILYLFFLSTIDHYINTPQLISHTTQLQHFQFPFYPSPQKQPFWMIGTLNLSFSTASVRPPIRSFTATSESQRPARLYEVLQIKQNALAAEIKATYRSLEKVYHPDSAVLRSESNEREFIEIHDMYETLSNPAARAMYDLSLTAARGGYRPLVTMNWETDQCW